MGRVVLVHGFTQTPASWEGVVARLDDLGVESVALDVAPLATFEDTARALGDEGGAGVWVGYSMGGRLALRLALDRPELVQALVLVGASPGLADPDERAARVAADEELAATIERDGVDAFLDGWLARPLFATVPDDAPGLVARRLVPADVLTGSLRVLGTGAMEPLWDRIGELRMPVVLVTGADDEKFDGIARRMLGLLPAGGRHVRVPGGHAVLLEMPDTLADLVAEVAATV